jgi:glycosyltransferase involved in cell wall biosynthesis
MASAIFRSTSLQGSFDMKVLMVISQFHPIIGGAEKQAQLLGQALVRKGIGVNVVTGWWSTKTPRREKMHTLDVFRNFSCWGMFGIKGIRTLGGLIYMLSLAAYLFIHRREYDIIHVHQVLYPSFVSVLMGKTVLKKPVLVKYACTGITNDMRQLKQFPLGGLQLNYLLKAMDCVVTVSQNGIDEFKTVGYPESRVAHIPNGVLAPSEGKTSYDRVRRVITTARLDKQKGIDVLLRAWAHVVRTENEVILFIIGQGPAEGDLKRLTEQLGIGSSVKFPGVTHDIDSCLKEADLFVLPSRAEGLSNALLEAMSYGIPCITTNIPGNAELIGTGGEGIPAGGFAAAKNGLLFNTDDVGGLTEALRYFIRNPEEREKKGRRGRAFVHESYSIETIADKYIALYQRLLEERD